MRIGKTGIPSQNQKRLIADGYLIFEHCNNRQATKQDLADSLGIGITGSLNQKIGDLKKIGILKGQENSFRETDFALEMYTKKDPEHIVTSFKRIPFYGYILGKYNGTPITYDIVLKELIEFAKLKPEVANSQVDRVYRLFHESEEFVFSKPNLEEFFTSVKEETKGKQIGKEVANPPPTSKPRLEFHIPPNEPVLKSESDNKKPMEKKFVLTVLYRDEIIPVIDEESYRFAEYLFKKLGKELGIKSEL